MTELEALIPQIDEKVQTLKEHLAEGKAASFEEYKRLCGEIRGLLTARGYALDLKSAMENMDD